MTIFATKKKWGKVTSDVEKIITSVNAGKSFEYDDYNGIKSFITRNYLSFIENNTIERAKGFEEYSVKNQVKKNAKFLKIPIYSSKTSIKKPNFYAFALIFYEPQTKKGIIILGYHTNKLRLFLQYSLKNLL